MARLESRLTRRDGTVPERRSRLLAGLLLVSLTIYLVATAYKTWQWSSLENDYHPVLVTIEGEPSVVSRAVVGYPQAIRYDNDDPVEAERPAEIVSALRHHENGGIAWQIDALVSEIRLHLPADWQGGITTVTIASGDVRQRFERADLATWDPVAARDTVAIPGVPLTLRSPAAPQAPVDQWINRPAPGAQVPHAVSFVVLTGLCVSLLLAPRRFGGERLVSPIPQVGGAGSRTWPMAGFLVLAAVLAGLEGLDPYYFTQDDNFSQFLPYIAYASETLVQGAWPDFNPYQFAGTPVASLGTYAVSYPGTWLSWMMATAVGRPMATLEIFAVLHLLAAYPAAYALGRTAGLERWGAAAVALSFVLCGYFLVAGRSWYYMVPVALWFPLLLRSGLTLEETHRPLRWVLATGLVVGLFFHAGNAQMWTYSVTLWGLLLLWRWSAGRLDLRRMMWAGCALVTGIGLALPQLVPQLAHAARIQRLGGVGFGLWDHFAALFIPYGLLGGTTANGYGEDIPHLYYSGTLYTLLGGAATLVFVGLWSRWRLPAMQRLPAGWLLLGSLTLLVGLGRPAGLWPLLAQAPGFKYFNIPYKVLPFLILLLNLGGALAAQRWFGRRTGAGIAAAVMVLVASHALNTRDSFYSYGTDPYPPLPPDIAAVIDHGDGLGERILAVVPRRSPLASFPFALGQNYPTVYRIPALGGYDPLIEDSFDDRALYVPLKYDDGTLLQALGVRWLIYYTAMPAPDPTPGPGTQRTTVARWSSLALTVGEPVLRRADLAIYDLGRPSPIAFLADAPEQALPARLAKGRVEVDLPPGTGERAVVLNFLHRPGSRVTGDDGMVLAAERDAIGRIKVRVPQAVTRLELSYDGGWGKGLLLGLAMCAAGLGGALAIGRWKAA